MATKTKIMRVLITAREPRTLDALLGEHRLDTTDSGPRADAGGVSVEALVTADQVKRLAKRGITITVLDKNAGATGRKRQREVGKGNPFGGETGVPRGLGRKVREGGHALP